MKDQEIYGKPQNLCCFKCISFAILLNGISNIYKLERLKVPSKITYDLEKLMKVIHINFISSYCSSMTAMPRDERGRMKAGKSSQTRERGPILILEVVRRGSPWTSLYM